jgi:bifunctional non-homologous end joining protein LigD
MGNERRVSALAPERLRFGDREVALTSLDRVLWPQAGFSKRDLIDYYLETAPLILPHIRGHGLTLARYPQGVEERGFPQTECRGRPEWMATEALRLASGELRNHCVVDDAAGLAWVANQNTVELHPFLAPVRRRDRPDAVVFDLDPAPEVDFRQTAHVALRLRDELGAIGLRSFVKTSGARGLHVHVPLAGSAHFDDCKRVAREIAARLAAADPTLVTDSLSPARRGPRVLIDWSRMTPQATLVAPYSLRAMSRATVAMPLRWEELEAAPREGLWFGPQDVGRRRERDPDPFGPLPRVRQRLPSS